DQAMTDDPVLPDPEEGLADVLAALGKVEPAAPAPELEAAAMTAAGEGDPDVALGNLLIVRGLIDAERAAEAWRLLLGYQREFPAVELSHVLVKHGMVSREAIRELFSELEERPAPAAEVVAPEAPAAVPAAPPPSVTTPRGGDSLHGLPV